MKPVLPQKIPTRKWPVFLIFGICLLPFYISYKPESINLIIWMTSIVVLIIIAFAFILSRNNIIIEDASIIHEKVFGKGVELTWSEITHVKLQWIKTNNGMGLSFVIEATSGKKISFDPTIFSRKNLQLILDTIVDKCPGVSFDKKTKKMLEENFPWYIF